MAGRGASVTGVHNTGKVDRRTRAYRGRGIVRGRPSSISGARVDNTNDNSSSSSSSSSVSVARVRADVEAAAEELVPVRVLRPRAAPNRQVVAVSQHDVVGERGSDSDSDAFEDSDEAYDDQDDPDDPDEPDPPDRAISSNMARWTGLQKLNSRMDINLQRMMGCERKNVTKTWLANTVLEVKDLRPDHPFLLRLCPQVFDFSKCFSVIHDINPDKVIFYPTNKILAEEVVHGLGLKLTTNQKDKWKLFESVRSGTNTQHSLDSVEPSGVDFSSADLNRHIFFLDLELHTTSNRKYIRELAVIDVAGAAAFRIHMRNITGLDDSYTAVAQFQTSGSLNTLQKSVQETTSSVSFSHAMSILLHWLQSRCNGNTPVLIYQGTNDPVAIRFCFEENRYGSYFNESQRSELETRFGDDTYKHPRFISVDAFWSTMKYQLQLKFSKSLHLAARTFFFQGPAVGAEIHVQDIVTTLFMSCAGIAGSYTPASINLTHSQASKEPFHIRHEETKYNFVYHYSDGDCMILRNCVAVMLIFRSFFAHFSSLMLATLVLLQAQEFMFPLQDTVLAEIDASMTEMTDDASEQTLLKYMFKTLFESKDYPSMEVIEKRLHDMHVLVFRCFTRAAALVTNSFQTSHLPISANMTKELLTIIIPVPYAMDQAPHTSLALQAYSLTQTFNTIKKELDENNPILLDDGEALRDWLNMNSGQFDLVKRATLPTMRNAAGKATRVRRKTKDVEAVFADLIDQTQRGLFEQTLIHRLIEHCFHYKQATDTADETWQQIYNLRNMPVFYTTMGPTTRHILLHTRFCHLYFTNIPYRLRNPAPAERANGTIRAYRSAERIKHEQVYSKQTYMSNIYFDFCRVCKQFEPDPQRLNNFRACFLPDFLTQDNSAAVDDPDNHYNLFKAKYKSYFDRWKIKCEAEFAAARTNNNNSVDASDDNLVLSGSCSSGSSSKAESSAKSKYVYRGVKKLNSIKTDKDNPKQKAGVRDKNDLTESVSVIDTPDVCDDWAGVLLSEVEKRLKDEAETCVASAMPTGELIFVDDDIRNDILKYCGYMTRSSTIWKSDGVNNALQIATWLSMIERYAPDLTRVKKRDWETNSLHILLVTLRDSYRAGPKRARVMSNAQKRCLIALLNVYNLLRNNAGWARTLEAFEALFDGPTFNASIVKWKKWISDGAAAQNAASQRVSSQRAASQRVASQRVASQRAASQNVI
jgi:hypothetical protein